MEPLIELSNRLVEPKATGEAAMLGVRGPGEAFGDLALVSGGSTERSATVSALEPGETSVLPDDFARLPREHPGINAVLVAILAESVRWLSEQVTEAYYLSADYRVVRRLADLAALYGGTVPFPRRRSPSSPVPHGRRSTESSGSRRRVGRSS